MCLFTDPPCSIPYLDRSPTNGALLCGTDNYHYPRVCRVHCPVGYELRYFEHDHLFKCDWSGKWDLTEPWPECYSKSCCILWLIATVGYLSSRYIHIHNLNWMPIMYFDTLIIFIITSQQNCYFVSCIRYLVQMSSIRYYVLHCSFHTSNEGLCILNRGSSANKANQQ